MKRIPFMSVPGSDKNAAAPGDNAQHVQGSTAPGTPVKKPLKINAKGGTGQFTLPKQRK